MLPVERVQKIKTLIQNEKHVKIAELSKMLNVSEMTIHRDIKPLVEEGFITKTFGGISLAENNTTNKNNSCIYCNRPNLEKNAYRLILPNNKIESACCSHCGLLRHHQLNDIVIQALCTDFLKQTTINAPTASFVLDTSIDIGCCQPQVLSFEWEEHAQSFVKGFGGHVYSFQEAMQALLIKMNNTCSHHKEKETT